MFTGVYMKKIALCAIARMENSYITDWLDYHLQLGFDHVFLYDNFHTGESRISEVVDTEFGPYQGKVTIIEVPDRVCCQMAAYNECYASVSKDFDWVCFIDIDEYLTFEDRPDGLKCIQDFLQRFDAETDAVLINWQIFDDNGYIVSDGRSVQERFRKPLPIWFSANNMWGKQPENLHVKSILRTNRGFSFLGPHVAEGIQKACNARGEIVPNIPIQVDVCWEVCYLRHFIKKTITEYLDVKMHRGGGAGKIYHLAGFFTSNKPTIRKMKLYFAAAHKIGVTPQKSIRWWAKIWVKMWIITPLLTLVKKT